MDELDDYTIDLIKREADRIRSMVLGDDNEYNTFCGVPVLDILNSGAVSREDAVMVFAWQAAMTHAAGDMHKIVATALSFSRAAA